MWQQFSAACAADPAATDAAGSKTAALRTAVQRLDASPLVGLGGEWSPWPPAARPVRIRVDGGKLLRVVRATLGGDGPANLASLPTLVAAASEGETDPLLEQVLGNDPTACAGRRPECVNPGAFVWGVYLSVMCRDVVPFETAATPVPASTGPGFERIAADELLTAACEAWNVPPADPAVARPAAFATPMLVYTGQLDSWSAHPNVEAALPGLSGASYFEVPGQTHNVMGFTVTSRSPCATHGDRSGAGEAHHVVGLALYLEVGRPDSPGKAASTVRARAPRVKLARRSFFWASRCSWSRDRRGQQATRSGLAGRRPKGDGGDPLKPGPRARRNRCGGPISNGTTSPHMAAQVDAPDECARTGLFGTAHPS